ncbi:family 2 glycosyl transferase [Calothrix sp. NIES-4071]|nr:family 2 glycosyl transferase [Calothrix sp. NIES-4071]BAZ63065.1 family 2 glycosyl transferase [Calothrix sp. NIES-4105]
MTTLVSIILPCYNRASYIEKCVKSVLAQTYTDIECILVDDGSKDNTREIAEQLMTLDSRVQYFYKENGGLSSARNFGIEKARGEWIQCLDPDDWIHEDKTRFQLSYLEGLDNQNNQNVLFYCDYERVFLDNDQNILRREPNIIGSLTRDQLIQRLLLPDFLASSPFPVLQQCMLVKKELLLSKKFDDGLKALQDRDFALELLDKGVDFIYTPIVGAYYTKHETNMSSNWEYMKNDYVLFYEIESRKNVLFQKYSEPAVKYWLEQTLIEKDKNNYFRLAKITNYPVALFDGQFRVNNKLGYILAYLMRILLPEFMLYKHSRSPKTQKIFDFFHKSFRLSINNSSQV